MPNPSDEVPPGTVWEDLVRMSDAMTEEAKAECDAEVRLFLGVERYEPLLRYVYAGLGIPADLLQGGRS